MLVFVLIVLCICLIISIIAIFQGLAESEQDTFFAAWAMTIMLIMAIVFTSIKL